MTPPKTQMEKLPPPTTAITEGSGPTVSLPKHRELREHLVHIPSANDQGKHHEWQNTQGACASVMR